MLERERVSRMTEPSPAARGKGGVPSCGSSAWRVQPPPPPPAIGTAATVGTRRMRESNRQSAESATSSTLVVQRWKRQPD